VKMKRALSCPKHFILVLCVFSVAVARSVLATAVKKDPCTLSSKEGEICKLGVDKLRPTQFAVGLDEVKCKTGRLEAMSSKDLKKYLEKEDNQIPIIIGLDGFYMKDGHHLTRALFDSDIDDDEKELHCEVLYNWQEDDTADTSDEFWQRMVDQQHLWLHDNKGINPVAPDYLPNSIEGLLNDAFRTLAWMVRTNGGYEKTDIAFAEFLWADFFRQNIQLKPVNAKFDSKTEWCQVRPYSDACLGDEGQALSNALPEAMILAISPLARGLPGYGSGVVDPPNCGDTQFPFFRWLHFQNITQGQKQ